MGRSKRFTSGPRALRLVMGVALAVAACDEGGAASKEPGAAPARDSVPAKPAARAPAPPQPADPPSDESACERDAKRCVQQGRAARQAGEPGAAKELFERACAANSPEGCYELALVYRKGRGVKPQPERAAELLALACQLGSTVACDAMGH